jgi:hypothetical protein
MTTRAVVRLIPGSGHVARRGDAVLYLPERDERLLEAFLDSAEGGELQAVASATVAAGFDVRPFVGVAWTPVVRVMAFGDVAVETDQPSLPMLSGAGSRTWVEHSMEIDSAATIDAGASDATFDPATDLTSGVALAGGFRLELTGDLVAQDAAPTTPTETAEDIEPVVTAPADATEQIPRPAPSAAREVDEPTPPTVDTDDPAAALAAIQAAAMGTDGRPVYEGQSARDPAATAPPRPPEVAEVAEVADVEGDESHDVDITLPPPAPGELLGDLMRQRGDAADDSRGSLVEAKLCPDGHPNPPVVASCAICGQFLTPGMATIVHIPRPSLGHLELDDGTIVELDHELLVGRNPDRDDRPERAGLRRVKVVGDKVSRSHLELRYQGWDVFVSDCGSTNGTFVVPHPGGQVAALEPGRAQLLEPGATVYFGSRSFTVVGRETG